MIHATAIGRIGRDAEGRKTDKGRVWNFTLATRGKGKDETIWIRCALWGERWEKLSQYLVKGTIVLVAGQLSARVYDGKPQIDLSVESLELGGANKKKDAAPAKREPGDDDGFPEGW
jgi:single-strand DNA-binding protein